MPLAGLIRNIQQPTSNTQHPMLARLAVVGCWMLDVGCWMLDVGCWLLGSNQHAIERRKSRREDRLALQVKPPFEHGRIDSSEISVELRGIRLEVREARMRAPEPAFDFAADHEHGRGGAVVCPTTPALRQRSAELREGHDQHRIQEPVLVEIVNEG